MLYFLPTAGGSHQEAFPTIFHKSIDYILIYINTVSIDIMDSFTVS
jgi:hypothetical protein